MPHEIPTYLNTLRTAQPAIEHQWEVGDSMVALGNPTQALRDNVDLLSLRALLGMEAALSEWMVERFKHFAFDALHVSLNEAVWAASIDLRYLNRKALVFPDENGPLKGPPRLCKKEVRVVCDCYPQAEYGMVDCVIATANLVRYVLPKEHDRAFQAWFKTTIRRLQSLSAPPIFESAALDIEVVEAPPEGVSYEIFGTPVPREAFDPEFDLDSADQVALIEAMLQSIASSPNPYLHSTESLLAAGFPGTPYRFTG